MGECRRTRLAKVIMFSLTYALNVLCIQRYFFTTSVYAYQQGGLQTPFVQLFSVGHMFKNKHFRLTDEVVLNFEADNRIH